MKAYPDYMCNRAQRVSFSPKVPWDVYPKKSFLCTVHCRQGKRLRVLACLVVVVAVVVGRRTCGAYQDTKPSSVAAAAAAAATTTAAAAPAREFHSLPLSHSFGGKRGSLGVKVLSLSPPELDDNGLEAFSIRPSTTTQERSSERRKNLETNAFPTSVQKEFWIRGEPFKETGGEENALPFQNCGGSA